MRVGGEKPFTAIITLTNEKNEIRVCNFVATKSHSQFELALTNVWGSLDLYGHPQPALIYTDNMSDKQFLEDCFPSLRQNITPVEKYGHLDELMVPPDITILVKNNTHSINDAMHTILDDVPEDEGFIVIGFDSEWNVEVSPQGKVIQRGKTAIIQVAYVNRIYILQVIQFDMYKTPRLIDLTQVAEMLINNELPQQLRVLLSHPRVLKAGRLVNADLTYLQKVSKSPIPFVGGVDLAKIAKDRHVTTSAQLSLSDLCAFILNKRLNKNVPERISQSWEDTTLTQDQLNYAARDAYVSLLLYQYLSKVNPPQRLPSNLTDALPVLVYNSDGTTIIAHGQVSANRNATVYDGIKLTPSKTVVDILEVLVPGAIISTHQKRPLNSFGCSPFSLVCLQSHLRTFNPATFRLPPPSLPTQSIDPALLPSQSAMVGDHEPDDIGAVSVSELLENDLPAALQTNPQIVNAASAALGEKILGPDPEIPNEPEFDSTLRSRILKDPFHVFNMFYLSTSHPLRAHFTRELRNAIFVPDEVDKSRIDAWGATQNPPQKYLSLWNTSPQWVRERCKHIIPAPVCLRHLVSRIFRTYGPLVDPKTGKPLFTSENWKTAKHVLDLIQNGYLSDPPGIPLYTVVGLDKKAGGLPMYRCSRGTNATEGGVHKHIRAHLPKCGASIRHANAVLHDFVLYHNLTVRDIFAILKYL